MAYNPEKVTSNQIAYQALREQGLSKCQAAKSLGLSNSYPAYLERTGKLKYDLTAKKMVSRAHLAIKNILEGQPVGESEAPKPSTIVTAASMIYDRYQPVIHHSTNITANISPVDMTKYMINIDNSMSAQLIGNQSGREQDGPGAVSPPHDVPIPIEGGEGKKENT